MRTLFKWRYLLYTFSMIAGWPVVFCFMGWLPNYTTNFVVLVVLSVLTAIISRKFKIPTPIAIILMIQLITFVTYSFIHSDNSYITRCMFLIITWALLTIQMQHQKTEFIDTNVTFLTIQAIMGGVGFVLFIMGLLSPISYFIEFDGHIGTFYGLFTTNASYSSILRVAGFFDEPGAFAFWGIVALLYNKLFINNRTVEVALIVGLISTLSMAYFIQLAIYAFLFYKNKMSTLLNFVVVFVALLLIVGSINEGFNDAIFGRFQIDEQTGTTKGDNRTILTEATYRYFNQSPIIGVGAQNLIAIATQDRQFVGANPVTFLATDGIVGQLILWLPLFYLLSLGKFKKKYLYAGIILFVGFMQRPYDPTELFYDATMYMLLLEGYRETFVYGGIPRSAISKVKFLPMKLHG